MSSQNIATSASEPHSDIQFVTHIQIHRDTPANFENDTQYITSHNPVMTLHHHTWWYWAIGIVGMKDENDDLQYTFILKSIGPCFDYDNHHPDNALNENIQQDAPIITSGCLLFGDVTYPLIAAPNGPDHTYVALNFKSRAEMLELFDENNDICIFQIRMNIPVAYFALPTYTNSSRISDSNVEKVVKICLSGKKAEGTDLILNFGDSRDLHVHRDVIFGTSSKLARMFDAGVSSEASGAIRIASDKGRLVFPTLEPDDAELFITYFYTRRVRNPCPTGYDRIPKVLHAILDNEQLKDFYSQWETLFILILFEYLYGSPEMIGDIALKAMIAIFHIPAHMMPRAKRVAVSIAAKETLAENVNSATIHERLMTIHPDYAEPNIDSMMHSLVKMRYHHLASRHLRMMGFYACNLFQFELGTKKWVPPPETATQIWFRNNFPDG
uniref:BTB domain-containing protein n=1 Tax=Panagrellus redivivus TaxID=6233 RepID=A0A7E4VJC1_PANRE